MKSFGWSVQQGSSSTITEAHRKGSTFLGAEDAFRRVEELVVPYGYPLERHFAITADGYVLCILRIPHGKVQGTAAQASSHSTHAAERLRQQSQSHLQSVAGSSGYQIINKPAEEGEQQEQQRHESEDKRAKKPVVLLAHGLLDSAAGFLVNGPSESLGFLLADQGNDVWLLNWRGNSLSRNHTRLSPEDAQYWAFSYDEMARYDLPAVLQCITRLTGVPDVAYLGHSQGTTVLLASLANPTTARAVSRLIRVGVLLAPVAVAKHISSLPLLAMAAMDTDGMFSLLGFHEFLPSQETVASLEGLLCRLQPYLCVSFLTALCGYNPNNLNATRLPLYLSHTPAGTSVQNMAHWAQAVRSRAPNTMAYFDYGTDCVQPGPELPARCNQLVYGSLNPPHYDLTSICTPLAIFTGAMDRLSTPMDVEYLMESLPPGVVVGGAQTVLQDYEHLDFIWGADAPQRLYSDVLDLIHQYSPNAAVR